MNKRLALRKGYFLLIFLGSLNFGLSQDLLQRIGDPIPAKVVQMYDKGINYLVKNNTPEIAFHMEQEPAVAACAILAILARSEGLESPQVASCLNNYLELIFKSQDQNSGYIGNSMYNHGFCTLALAEAYGVIDEKRLATALKKAVELILKAQGENPQNGWRYTPESVDADSTVSGCQIVALLAARNAGIIVPDESIDSGLLYLRSCRGEDGSYGYTNANNGKPTLTAIGVLCQYLAKKEPDEVSKKSVEYLKKRLNYRDQHYPFYYEYYMSQALFQATPDVWKDWNKRNIRYLALSQASDGSWDGNHGKIFSTSAALLSLALNYRFMPIYERF